MQRCQFFGKGGSEYIGGLGVKPACPITQNLMAIVNQREKESRTVMLSAESVQHTTQHYILKQQLEPGRRQRKAKD